MLVTPKEEATKAKISKWDHISNYRASEQQRKLSTK